MTESLSFLIPEDEDVEDRQVERQTQHELYNHQPGEDLICDWIGCLAVVNCSIRIHHVFLAGSRVREVTVNVLLYTKAIGKMRVVFWRWL